MKCPKCSYLGFETGNTCKNCGYDFSLLIETPTEPAADRIDVDLDLRTVENDLLQATEWPDAADIRLSDSYSDSALDPLTAEEFLEPPVEELPPPQPAVAAPEPPLPLFPATYGQDDDAPLIKFPAAPRPPLAVRRTPDTPRLRVVPKPMRSTDAAPVLAFEAPEAEQERVAEAEPSPSIDPPYRVSHVWTAPNDGAISAPGVRLAATAVDHVLLGGVDAVVIYFTARIAGIAMGEWMVLPPAPMIAFLLMLKLAYFAAFTAVGGQTIGKMAFRLRVVGANRAPIDGSVAVKRTIAATLSGLTLGLGYVPAFFDSERRTLHDHVARTRVVSLPSA